MAGPNSRDTEGNRDGVGEPPQRKPFTLLACFWVAGVAAGMLHEATLGWAIAAGALLLLAIGLRIAGRSRAAMWFALVSTTAAAASWTNARASHVRTDDVRRFVTDGSQLTRVVGVVASPPQISPPRQGAFGGFSFRPPATYAVLDLESLETGAGRVPVTGSILLKIHQADHRLVAGSRIEATGWFAPISPPANPGEFDYARQMSDRGIHARLSLPQRENWRLIDAPNAASFTAFAERLSSGASASLRADLSPNPVRAALLDALLLGRWDHNLSDLADDFRRTGLMHLLSISGAHLSILLGLAWAIGRLLVPHPPRPALFALAMLAFYLVVVPPQVPLTRAGIMAGAFVFAFATGRKATGLEALSLAAIAVLLWRPQDIANPGAQLSFLGVASLLLFTRPLSQRLSPKPDADEIARIGQIRVMLRRATADFIAANIVASSLSIPLIAYHFGMACPLGALLSMLMLPVVSVVMTVGFIKLSLGALFPSIGAILAWALAWLTDTFIGMVELGARAPGAFVELPHNPSALWTIASTVFLVAVFTGFFRRRLLAFVACLSVCVGWCVWPLQPQPLNGPSERPILTLHSFAVGDGSCFLARSADASGREETVMFDCGSSEYFDLSRRSIVPSLQSLGVSRIDTLIVSHADLDHFCGVLDLADLMPVGRVMVTPQINAEAARAPKSAIALLLRGLRERRVPVETVSQGWSGKLGSADFELLWPPADLVVPRNNDSSAVLSIRAGGRRILLNGDIQQIAQGRLLATPETLRADVVDLPHHGSFVDTSIAWLRAASPSIVIQSTGAARLDHDKWRGVIPSSATRLITERDGAIRIDIARDGEMRWSTFRGRSGAVPRRED